MIKRIAGLAAATALMASTALAQGANVNNTVGVWGVSSSTGAPCLIAPVGATGTPSCVLPSQPPTGGAATVTANQGSAGASAWPVATSPTARTIVALDISTVTTGGTAVTALNAGHRTAGGFLYNPINATINLCINEQGVASGTTSAGATTCIQPGQSYTLAPTTGAVSVVTSDSSHPFSGYGMN